ncbi:MAG: glucose-6-phosphate dehydrogenase [Acidimicrobiia bacterium]
MNRFVVFGASGDLASRLLLPALAELVAEGEFADGLEVVGVGREEYTRDGFRRRIHDALTEHASSVEPAVRARVVETLDYQQADVTDGRDVARVLGDGRQPVVVYVALPPHLFEPTLSAIADAGLARGSAVAIEKPFGEDLASARRLNDLLHTRLPEITVFRVDHFLSDELVQRVFALRFANRVLEPLWSREHIERVDIVWDETLALEGRAAYYDGAGALRDMIQSHLLATMCFVAMEQPSRADERSVRDARAAVLRAVPTPTPEEIRAGSLRARYAAGRVGDRVVPAYVDESGVDPARATETYAELTVRIENWRWAGVPFGLRSGKALGRNHAEIAIRFRRPPVHGPRVDVVPSNALLIGLAEPYVRLTMNVNAADRELAATHLEMTSSPPSRPAYANLLLEMADCNATLALRSDETEEQWRIVEPVLAAWRAGDVPMLEYPAGSDGPRPAHRAPATRP